MSPRGMDNIIVIGVTVLISGEIRGHAVYLDNPSPHVFTNMFVEIYFVFTPKEKYFFIFRAAERIRCSKVEGLELS